MVGGTGFPTPTATADAPASSERIVYTAIGAISPPGTEAAPGTFPADIFAIGAGVPAQDLTADNPYSDMYPSISADGTRIAWVRVSEEESGERSSDVWIMGADGSTRVRLTLDGLASTEDTPNFSPDSTWLAFNRRFAATPDQPPGPYMRLPEPWAVSADGTQVRLAEKLPGALDPVVSPDGSQLAVRLDGDLWISALDGSNAINVTGSHFPDRSDLESEPDFSPDGRSLVFQVGKSTIGNRFPFEIYTVNVDGTGLTNLTPGESSAARPALSPDGSHIAYVARPSGGQSEDIWVMRADGTDPVDVTNTPTIFEDWPDWGHLVVPPPAKRPMGDCDDPNPTLSGTGLQDVLPGTRGGDVIAAEAGDDNLVGGVGKDVLCGSDGTTPDVDELDGGGNTDILDGGPGPDLLVGGPGDDLLIGGRGNDQCVGGPGKDRLRNC